DEAFIEFDANGSYTANIDMHDGWYYNGLTFVNKYTYDNGKLVLTMKRSPTSNFTNDFSYYVSQDSNKLILTVNKKLFLADLEKMLSKGTDLYRDLEGYIADIDKFDVKYTFIKK
ncbi:MAG: hypothetical protein ACRCVT_02595, partial [Leadbetterella sp.]